MDELFKKKQIEEFKNISASEQFAEQNRQFDVFARENVSGISREQRLKAAINTQTKTKTRKDTRMLDLANETLRSLIPGVPEDMIIVSGMTDGAVVTEPPRPVALRRK